MSYRKIGKNKYFIEVEKTINKKRKRKTKTITTPATGKDLDFLIMSIEKELIESIQSNIEPDIQDANFKTISDLFLAQSQATQRTKDSYEQLLRLRTLDFFGHMTFTEIKKHDIISFISSLKSEISKKTGKPLSPKTIKHYRNLLQVIFNYAKDELEIIEKNPVAGVKIPTVSGEIKRDFLESDQVQETILKLSKYGDLKYFVFFILEVYTGCRPSELYGLKWEKIDFKSGIITINEALVKTKKGYIQKTTKSKDCRKQKLSPYILMKLNELKEIEAYKYPGKDQANQYVFTNDQGLHLGQAAFKEYFRRFCQKQGIKYVPPYSLRHTSGTLLSESSIPLKSIGSHLGHTNQSTTEKYVHATKKIDDQIEEILTSVTTPKILKIN